MGKYSDRFQKQMNISVKILLTGTLVTLLLGCSGTGGESIDKSSDIVPVIPQITTTQKITIPPTDHPLLVQQTPVPNNEPLVMSTLIPNPLEQPSLLDDDLPDIVISMGSQIFSGNLDYTGPITTTNGTIEINQSDASPIIIQYRLPQQIGPIPDINFGTVKLISKNTPGYIHREILISDDVGLIFGQILKNTESPITIELGGPVSLAQSSVDGVTPDSSNSLVLVNVNMIDAGSVTTPIPISSPHSIPTTIGNIDVFVDISFYNKSNPLYSESFTGYSLDTWIVRKR
jgi:hypothetical protein